MMNTPTGPAPVVYEGFPFRGFATPVPASSPFSFGTLGRAHANPTPAFGRPHATPNPSGWQGLQQPSLNLFGAHTPAAQGFAFGEGFRFQGPTPGPFGTRPDMSSAQPAPTVAASVPKEKSNTPITTKPQQPETPYTSSPTAQHAVPTPLYPTYLGRQQPPPNLFVPTTTATPQSLEPPSTSSQTSQESISTATTPSKSTLDLSTIAESLPATPTTPQKTAAVEVVTPLPTNTNDTVSQPKSPARSLSSPTKLTDGKTPNSSPIVALETREDQAKAQETTR